MFDKKKMFLLCFVLLLVLILILYLLLRKRKPTAKQSTTVMKKPETHTATAKQQNFTKNIPNEKSDITSANDMSKPEMDAEIEENHSEPNLNATVEETSSEEAIALEEDLFKDENPEEEESLKEDESLKQNASAIFFWTPNGKSYHADQNCTYLKRSKTIISGTEQEAKEAGKTTVCSVCSTTK